MLLSLIAVSGFFKIEDHHTRLIMVAVFSCLPFVFFYSIGAGPIPFTLSAEVFPLCVRGNLILPFALPLVWTNKWQRWE